MLHDPKPLADALLYQTAGWARAGLTAPTVQLREKAAQELVATLLDTLERPAQVVDENQLCLSL